MLKFSGSSYLIWDQGSEQSSMVCQKTWHQSSTKVLRKGWVSLIQLLFLVRAQDTLLALHFKPVSRDTTHFQHQSGLRISRYSNRHALRNTKERNMRSKIRWFTEFCNSHYVSHFAAFFIVARAKRSVVKSCFLFVQENQDSFNVWFKIAVSRSRQSQNSPRTLTVHTV
jgi:hypothetical protein